MGARTHNLTPQREISLATATAVANAPLITQNEALAKQDPFFRGGWRRRLCFGRNDRICRQQERRGGTGVRGFDYFPPSLGKALL